MNCSDMLVYRLQCVCNESTSDIPAHGSIGSKHLYVRYSSVRQNNIYGYMVVAEGPRLALIKGTPESIDKIHACEKNHWFCKIRIEYIRRFDIEILNDRMGGSTDVDCEAFKELCPLTSFNYSRFWDSIPVRRKTILFTKGSMVLPLSNAWRCIEQIFGETRRSSRRNTSK
jgi:hypothetical protein